MLFRSTYSHGEKLIPGSIYFPVPSLRRFSPSDHTHTHAHTYTTMAGLADMLDSMLRVVAGGQSNSDGKADLNAATDHTVDENYSQCARV